MQLCGQSPLHGSSQSLFHRPLGDRVVSHGVVDEHAYAALRLEAQYPDPKCILRPTPRDANSPFSWPFQLCTPARFVPKVLPMLLREETKSWVRDLVQIRCERGRGETYFRTATLEQLRAESVLEPPPCFLFYHT